MKNLLASRRLLAILLALSMCLSLLPTAAFAAGNAGAGAAFRKVTSVDELTEGSQVIIVADTVDKAMGAQSNNIRSAVDITKSADGTYVYAGPDVQILTLGIAQKSNSVNDPSTSSLPEEEPSTVNDAASGNQVEDLDNEAGNEVYNDSDTNLDGDPSAENESPAFSDLTAENLFNAFVPYELSPDTFYTFSAGSDGNLYAVSGQNQLKTQTYSDPVGDEALFEISITSADGVTSTSIVAQGPAGNENVNLTYNITSPRFCCYKSKQAAVSLYILDEDAIPAVTASPEGGDITGETEVTLALGPGASDAEIYYTTDESDPTNNSSATRYESPITITQTTTLKAAAKKDSEWGSVSTWTYTLLTKVATPTANPAGGNVLAGATINFSCTTAGATIQYTVGDSTTPVTGNSYTIPADTPANTTLTIKVKATKSGLTDSDEATFTYTVSDAPLKDGANVVIYNPVYNKALSCTYTGSYNAGVTVDSSGGKLTGYGRTEVWTVTANNDGTYSFTPLDGTQKLGMAASGGAMTLGATHDKWNVGPFSYTDAADKTYDGYLITNTGRTGMSVQWYASKDNWSTYSNTSNKDLFVVCFETVADADLPKPVVATPTFTPASGVVTDDTLTDGKLTVSIACTEQGAEIYYTTNGDAPTTDSTKYASPFELDLSSGTAHTVKAIAVKENMENSAVAEITYSKAVSNSDFRLVTDVTELTSGEGGYFVLLPKDFFDRYHFALSTSFASKPTAVPNVTLEEGTYAPTLKITPFSGGKGANAVSVGYETTGKYIGWADGTNFAEMASPYEMNVTANADGTFRFLFSDASTRSIAFQSNGADGGVFGAYAVSNDGKTSTSGGVTNGPYECDMLVYRSMNGYLYNPTVSFATVNKAVPGVDYEISYELAETDQVSNVKGYISLDTASESPQWTELAPENVDTASRKLTIPASMFAAADLGGGFRVKVTATDTRDGKISQMEASTQVSFNQDPVITAFSPANGGETGADKRPAMEITVVNGGNFTAKITYTAKGQAQVTADMTVDTAAGKAVYTPAAALPDGTCSVSVVVTSDKKDEDGNNRTATRSWYFTVGTAVYRNYFGQAHSHTNYSDGTGSLTDALAYIKDTAYRSNVQFVAFTDHSNYFDGTSGPKNDDETPGAAANAQALYYPEQYLTANQLANWRRYQNDVAAFNTANAGQMVALAGFEMTWSGGPGHINTFNTPGIVSRNNTTLNNKTNDAGMKAYYALLKQDEGADSISQFNHPGVTFGTFSDFAYFDEVLDTRMTLVEVGNGEGAIGNLSGYFPSYSEYIKALDKGWHLAPTNNQDNHKGKWGDANDARTVAYMSDLTEDSIYQAMRDMRIYATEDKNLDITYFVNGQVMGSIINEVPDTATFTFTAKDPDPSDSISKLEIVTNSGRVALTVPVNETGEYTATLDNPDAGYYFLRVTEADKDIAVTAPVWLGKAKAVGMENLSTDASIVVRGEAITIRNQFYNNESVPATISSVTYELDGAPLGITHGLNAMIPSTGTYDNEFSYTFVTAGTHTLTITATITVAGVSRELTSSLEVSVKDPGNLVYIGFDGSHHNEYVAGHYNNRMGNFASMAAKYDTRVVILETGEELLSALNDPQYKMMVFTPPSRRLELTTYDVYSQEELNAIAAFAQRGGTVVVTGWGDYYESYANSPKAADMQMSYQQNQILKALGSSLRVADDEAKDETNKPGSNASRLYLNDYNGFRSPLLAGVDPSQLWSQYGGSTVYAVDAGGNPVSTLPSSVIPIISGYGKYESDGSGVDLNAIDSYDDDKDGYMNGQDAGVKPPKYTSDNGQTVLLVASEQVGSGLILVSGGAFMSDYEIKLEVDDVQLGYSNANLADNLIESLNLNVTPISEVRRGAMGETFTVEGYITANTSGYDVDTAFFDCSYVEDATGGINIFPLDGNYQIGQRVRVTGYISEYEGEIELMVERIKVLDSTPASVTPTKATTEQAASGAFLGQLIEVQGTVTSVELEAGYVQTIRLVDSSNVPCRIYINGYITTDKDAALQQIAKVGNVLNVIGISTCDNPWPIESEWNRIRIRDRADITLVSESPENPDDSTESPVTPPNPGGSTGTGGGTGGSTPAVTIPISGDSTSITVSATVSGTTATISKIDTSHIEAVIGEHVQTGNVVIDLTGLDTAITTVKLPASVIRDIAEAASSSSNDATGLTVKLTSGEITFDSKALDAVQKQAGSQITLTIAEAKSSDMNSLQKQAVGSAPVYVLTLSSGSRSITDFGGGYATVALPYKLQDGQDPSGVVVYYLDGTGNIHACETMYDVRTEAVIFTTGHLSLYFISYTGPSGETAWANTFLDVNESAWYYDAIRFVCENSLMNGFSATQFGPNQNLTRAQLTQILYNKEGQPAVTVGNMFSDVGSSAWCAAPVSWAVSIGVVNGYNNGLFGANDDITREQLVTILWRYVGSPMASSRTLSFSDADSASAYTVDALCWAVENGVIQGTGDNMLDPAGSATRAQIATIFQRMIEDGIDVRF